MITAQKTYEARNNGAMSDYDLFTLAMENVIKEIVLIRISRITPEYTYASPFAPAQALRLVVQFETPDKPQPSDNNGHPWKDYEDDPDDDDEDYEDDDEDYEDDDEDDEDYEYPIGPEEMRYDAQKAAYEYTYDR